MNYLHNSYRRAGKISNDDMLYTLSLFALEQVRWTKRYEWRSLSDVEVCALGVLWKDIGDSMEITYERLESDDWADGLQWMDEMEAWSMEYEAKHMLPADSNRELAAGSREHLLAATPGFMKPVMRKLVAALMQDRLRIAMMYVSRLSLRHLVFGCTRLR